MWVAYSACSNGIKAVKLAFKNIYLKWEIGWNKNWCKVLYSIHNYFLSKSCHFYANKTGSLVNVFWTLDSAFKFFFRPFLMFLRSLMLKKYAITIYNRYLSIISPLPNTKSKCECVVNWFLTWHLHWKFLLDQWHHISLHSKNNGHQKVSNACLLV